MDQYQNTVIRFSSTNADRNEDESVEIGIERDYQPNRRGRDYMNVKTGPWCVVFKNGSILSTSYMPPDVAREAAAAIVRHSEECDRRNQAEQNPQPVE